MNFYSKLLFKTAKSFKFMLPRDFKDQVRQRLVEIRRESAIEISELMQFNPTAQVLAKNERITKNQHMFFGTPPQSAVWFVPYIPYPYYGGIYTIYRFCSFLAAQGIETTCCIRGCPKEKRNEYISMVRSTFKPLADIQILFLNSIDDIEKVPDSDIAFATDWPSAYSLVQYNNTKVKYYFIQDYEPLCYASGPTYGLAELTYHFGFIPVVNTQGLHEYYCKLHSPDRSFFFNPAVDTDIFHSNGRIENESLPTRIFYYCRPGAGRNGFTTGLAALKEVKERWENRVDIVMAGSLESDPILKEYSGYFNFLGLLPYNQTGDLYRRCHIGLVTMYTPHTSYLPLELMASGVAVVTNHSAAKDWLYKVSDEEVSGLYAYPTINDIADKIGSLIRDPEKRNTLAKCSGSVLKTLSWSENLEKFYCFLFS